MRKKNTQNQLRRECTVQYDRPGAIVMTLSDRGTSWGCSGAATPLLYASEWHFGYTNHHHSRRQWALFTIDLSGIQRPHRMGPANDRAHSAHSGRARARSIRRPKAEILTFPMSSHTHPSDTIQRISVLPLAGPQHPHARSRGVSVWSPWRPEVSCAGHTPGIGQGRFLIENAPKPRLSNGAKGDVRLQCPLF